MFLSLVVSKCMWRRVSARLHSVHRRVCDGWSDIVAGFVQFSLECLPIWKLSNDVALVCVADWHQYTNVHTILYIISTCIQIRSVTPLPFLSILYFFFSSSSVNTFPCLHFVSTIIFLLFFFIFASSYTLLQIERTPTATTQKSEGRCVSNWGLTIHFYLILNATKCALLGSMSLALSSTSMNIEFTFLLQCAIYFLFSFYFFFFICRAHVPSEYQCASV